MGHWGGKTGMKTDGWDLPIHGRTSGLFIPETPVDAYEYQDDASHIDNGHNGNVDEEYLGQKTGSVEY